MKRIFSLVLALVLVSVISLAGVNTASAKGKDKQPINIQSVIVVAGIDIESNNPDSGWTKIALETLVPPSYPAFEPNVFVIDGPADLTGSVLTAQQSSHEQFSQSDLFSTEVVVLKGKSKGTFFMSTTARETLVVGDYKLKLSNIPPLTIDEYPLGCQVFGQGKWKSKAKNSIIEGGGDITVCTNFNPYAGPQGTFVTQVSVTGSARFLD